ncbi:keratin-associated protein 5-4 [Protopterus annectens]|uniref:keratin-associated protein 5-4 n=1 Tax=Protopterus annectens TaxID=7888 RepID=UPI001CF9CF25|nr:keratin-associated protein 5-4 [Protopterus annectens]
MAPLTFPPVTVVPSSLVLPVPAIIIITVGAYLLLVLIAVMVRQCLMTQGMCVDCCSCSKGNQLGLSDCCLSCAETCDCQVPSMDRCLDDCCPRRKLCDIGNLLACNCCPTCDCACACQPPDCETINCICFEIRMK